MNNTNLIHSPKFQTERNFQYDFGLYFILKVLKKCFSVDNIRNEW